MTDLATIHEQRSTWRGRWLQAARVLLLVAIVAMIHFRHRARSGARTAAAITPSEIAAVYPTAASLRDQDGSTLVLDSDGNALGTVFRTSPEGDDVIGFSGPTNMQLAFDASGKLIELTIVSSEDTLDHVDQIRGDDRFLGSFHGLTQDEILNHRPDAVSGATLTSIAIRQSIVKRLGGVVMPGKFSEPVSLEDVKPLFEHAANIATRTQAELVVQDAAGKTLGYVIRTSPAADSEIGYQGPNDVLIALSLDRKVTGIALIGSYDNEPYVGYVREDWGFPTLFNDLSMNQLSELDLKAAEIEGVAGATMTSMGIARSLIIAARDHHKPPAARDNPTQQSSIILTSRDLGTIGVTLAGLIIGLSSLRGRKPIRITFQFVLIGYLGFVNGDMVSQTLLVGWARNGVPVSTSIGLVVLTIAALVLPVFSGRNVYCSHLCPHGAVQQLVRNRLPWKVKLSKRVRRSLRMLPALLLLWVVVVGVGGFAFSLVDIEPFNAWVFRIAGWATLAIAVIGLIASLFVPMAYCRFGCPTGALLEFTRTNRGSSKISSRDWLAIGCLLLGTALCFV